MSEQEINFLPFHAINEFMRNDYRLSVIRTALNAAPNLPEAVRKPLDQVVKRHVKVPGFRNADKAPAAIKAFPIAKAFEKNAEVVAAIIAAWTKAKPELHQQVLFLLEKRGWRFFPAELSLENLSPDKIVEWAILPDAVDRTRLPGFVTQWPKDDDFESLYKAFTETYPDVDEGIDNVSLMVVWITMRLPVDVEGEEKEESKESSSETQTEQSQD